MFQRSATLRAFTRADLLTLLGLGAVLLPLLTAQVSHQQPQDIRTAMCASNLRAISQAVALCETENNGYGPTGDDGRYVQNMLNWNDVLYDLDYLRSDRLRLCPADEHPDYPMLARAESWGFLFDDDFNDGQPPQPGIRTSYAINSIVQWNFREDRFEEPARQVYAMDGWWSWFGCLNAQWLAFQHLTGIRPNPVTYSSWQATMVGWRHSPDWSANAMFVDGHVEFMTARVPEEPLDLYRTVNTGKRFTWLPGERTNRFDSSSYQGSLPEYQGRQPYWTNPTDSKVIDSSGRGYPPDYPEHLSCDWRTENNAWIKFPNDRE